MREIKYLSPTAVMTWQKDPEAFYLQYCATNKPPKEPQNKAMAIGAAFDAYVKSYLTRALFGEKKGFDLKEIFENQVEKHNRDWALINGAWAFESYKSSGALADLMLELQGAEEEPRFEMTIENRVAHEACIEGIPLLGKPDIHYKRRGFDELRVVHDWKVNGYMSEKTTSPKKGYLQLYDNKEKRGFHKDAMFGNLGGLLVNISHPLETVDLSWATQTSIYSWMLGAEVGSRFLVGIHQLCCRGGGFPVIRVAAHRNYVGGTFQKQLHLVVGELWNKIAKGLILQSKERQEVLDRFYSGEDRDAFLEVSR